MPEAEHEGRVAVITGGGRGFGKAFGHGLAARGAQVVLADIDAAAATTAAAEIIAAGGRATAVMCDVANESHVEAMIADVIDRHGGIDILINNAGLHSVAYNAPMAQMGLGMVRRLFDVNVMGVIICSLAARKAMSGRVGASIVNISSSAAYSSGTAYGASKLAVRGITMTLAREFASEGIRVNAIAPGPALTEGAVEFVEAGAPQGIDVDAQWAAYEARIPLRRMTQPDDVARAAVFLASGLGAYVNGAQLVVDGGLLTA